MEHSVRKEVRNNMLLNLRQILQIAEEKEIAAGAFNTPNLESLRAVLDAAEELGLPVILSFAQCHESLTPLKVMGPMMVKLAGEASVPVCVHLDHGETLEYLKDALDMGFTSIMYDGSQLPYQENLANTRLAVRMAARVNASVEAELGSMGRRESGAGDAVSDDSKIYTDPVLAGRFVKDSGIDALACSFGTTHGIYLTKPRLDFDLVRKVRHETNGIPVVMHGGSGVSREDFVKAIRAGVRKINYFTYMDKAGGFASSDLMENADGNRPLFFSDLASAARKAMNENVKEAMRIFALCQP